MSGEGEECDWGGGGGEEEYVEREQIAPMREEEWNGYLFL